jgi:hypothetical protein
MENAGLLLRVYGQQGHELDAPDFVRIREYISTRSPLCGVDEADLVGFSQQIVNVRTRDYAERVMDFRYSWKTNEENLAKLALTIRSDRDCRWEAEILPVPSDKPSA